MSPACVESIAVNAKTSGRHARLQAGERPLAKAVGGLLHAARAPRAIDSGERDQAGVVSIGAGHQVEADPLIEAGETAALACGQGQQGSRLGIGVGRLGHDPHHAVLGDRAGGPAVLELPFQPAAGGADAAADRSARWSPPAGPAEVGGQEQQPQLGERPTENGFSRGMSNRLKLLRLRVTTVS